MNVEPWSLVSLDPSTGNAQIAALLPDKRIVELTALPSGNHCCRWR